VFKQNAMMLHAIAAVILKVTPRTTSLCSYIFLILRDHGMNMYVVYICKWSSAHSLGGVSGVASFINTDEQLQ